MKNLLFIPALLISFMVSGQTLSTREFSTTQNDHPDWQLVDVRTADEYSKGHIKGALNSDINGKEFENQIKALNKDVPVLVYCLSGGRSAKAAAYMRKEGFSVYELKGGMMQWKSEDFPIETSGPVAEGLTMNEFNTELSEHVLVLVDFYAVWCAPCKKMAPDLESLSTQYAGKFKLMKINVDENNTVVKELKVNAVPVIKLYKQGKVVWSADRLTEKAEIEKALLKNF